MAVFYPLAVTVTSPNWNSVLQMDGTAPAAANCLYGWTTGTAVAGYWLGGPGASARMTTTRSTPYLDQTTGPRIGTSATAPSDAFRTPLLNGTFATGTWTVAMALRAATLGSASARIYGQLWRGPNADGSSATKIGGIGTGSIVTITGTSATFTSSYGTTPGVLTLSNEYIFLEVECRVTTPSTSGTYAFVFRQGESTITTPAFTPAAVAYTLTVDPGAVALAGVSSRLYAVRNLIAQAGAIALSGKDTVLTVTRAARNLVAGVGAVALSGKDVTLRAARKLVAAPGAITLSGKPATLSTVRKLIAQTGAVTLTGNAAALTKAGVASRVLTAAYGAITVAGKTVTFFRKRVEASQVGRIWLSALGGPQVWDRGKWDQTKWDQYGIPVILRVGRKAVASTGAVVVSGAAILRTARRLTASAGAVTLSTVAPTLRIGRKLVASTGAVVMSGKAATLRVGHSAIASTGAITVTGYPATLTYGRGYRLTTQSGAIALTQYPVNLKAGRRITLAAGAINLTGYPATLERITARTLRPATGAINLTGYPVNLARTNARGIAPTTGTIWLNSVGGKYAWDVGRWDQATWDYRVLYATLRVGRRLVTQPGAITVTGKPVNLRASRVLRATQSSIVLTGKPANLVYAPAVMHDFKLLAAPGAITVKGNAATMRYARPAYYEPVSFRSLQNRKLIRGILNQRRL